MQYIEQKLNPLQDAVLNGAPLASISGSVFKHPDLSLFMVLEKARGEADKRYMS